MSEPLYRLVIADDHPLFRGALREAVSGSFGRTEIAEAGTFDEVSKLPLKLQRKLMRLFVDEQGYGDYRLRYSTE